MASGFSRVILLVASGFSRNIFLVASGFSRVILLVASGFSRKDWMDMKLSCDAAAPLIARYVDDALTDEDRVLLEKHLDACDDCRGALRAQREVAALLRTRVPDARVDLASRVSARLDQEAGVFGLANWRAWTLGLAPVAAALMLAAYLGFGASASTASQSATAGDEWATVATSVLMQPATSGDVLVEEVLTGSAESGGGARDVR